MDKRKAKKIAATTADVAAVTVSGVFRTVLKTFATILLIIITTGLLFTCIFAYYVKTNLSQDLGVTLEDMTLNLASTIYYTDESGNPQELASIHGNENRVWVDGENIPVNIKHAAIAIEDKRFMEHKGVDWYRTFGAFGSMFATMSNDFGGSTITQQLLKNITRESDITVQRKLREIFRALELERMYEKNDIMTWYLNVIYLGEGCNGVGTAAKAYFNKDVWDLTLAECASLIGITNNPSYYNPFYSKENNITRQKIILNEMYDQGFITQEELNAALAETLVFRHGENEDREMIINSYYVDAVYTDVINDLMKQKGIDRTTATRLVNNGGYQIYSCIDMKAQALVDSIYADRANFPSAISSKGEAIQSAAILLDPYTGAIAAMAGGIGEKTINLGYNLATQAQRPPGSSFKPIATYGPAVDQGLITPKTLVNDAPKLELQHTTWYPRNSGGGNRGITTILQALTSSLNTVSAQILDKLGADQSYAYLTEKLGFTSLVESDRDYAPLSLGQLTNGCTVREMAQAYSAFVNDGIFTYSRTYSRVTDSEGTIILDNSPETIIAFKANTAWVMDYMLNYAATYGTGAESNIGNMPHAGKTGTSTKDEDRWFVGFTPYYVCAVWTGYESPAYISAYGNPSSQVWKKIMQPLHNGLPYKNFKTPTIAGPTNIFGDLQPEESPSPSPEESVDPSESPTNTPPVVITPTPSTPVTPPPVVPTSPVVTPPPVTTPPPVVPTSFSSPFAA